MSVSESDAMTDQSSGIGIARCRTDIVEICAQRGRVRDLDRMASDYGWWLPPFGGVTMTPDRIALCVRPERWLLLSAPAVAGATTAVFRSACTGLGVAIDLSSALMGFHLSGAGARDLLARGCRLDLGAHALPLGHAAASIMAQVSVVFVPLPSGFLLLTPSTTSRHFCEWLESTALPLGYAPQTTVSVHDLFRSEGS